MLYIPSIRRWSRRGKPVTYRKKSATTIYSVHVAPLEDRSAYRLSRRGARAMPQCRRPIMNFHFAKPRDEQSQSPFFRLPRELHAEIITLCVPTSWQRFRKHHQDEHKKPSWLIKAERRLPALFSTCQEMLARAPNKWTRQVKLYENAITINGEAETLPNRHDDYQNL
ncbi:hypothetical protein FVEG_08951 [Fusarium verticillioides 7600]|uniref:Uncharacterized protein n=1 Tax=Gibberella moniliformis (strain M3125 / FGSC 7600) TaxID=334819 RepID=W7MD14_GIBM7|nr:hypothetical protein FVEG_08951 [Fusarium verticillioides 7600]EWG49408.1 hypothetical protein FVEG_08951 [Fusarium verticillioides 7600]